MTFKTLLSFTLLSFAFSPLLSTKAQAATTLYIGVFDQTEFSSGNNITIGTHYDGNTDPSSCTLYLGDESPRSMTINVSDAAITYTGTFSGGSYNDSYITCVAGTATFTGDTDTITIGDVTAPSVGAVSPAAAVKNVTLTLSATYADAIGVTSCSLFVEGVDRGYLNLSGGLSGTASLSYTFTATGTYQTYVSCTDAASNRTNGAATAVVVSDTADTQAPAVSNISPSSTTEDQSTTITATATDNVAIASCTLYVDNVSQGTMSLSGTTASKSHTFASSGDYDLKVTCTDAAGNTGSESDSISVDESSSGSSSSSSSSSSTSTDTTDPKIGAITPDSASTDIKTAINVSISDNVKVTSCDLYVENDYVGAMTMGTDYATYNHTFDDNGNFELKVKCSDAAGNIAWSEVELITVTEVPAAGLLVKLQCPSPVYVNDPCTTVYFYGNDGYRHAFPNEKVYFSWYKDYSTVNIVTADYLASLPLGKNVTYRPGYKLVKFLSVNTVYAVSQGGTLREISSESMASALYGTSWNTKVDDISDAFYSNYVFGDEINSSKDYSPEEELSGTESINGNW